MFDIKEQTLIIDWPALWVAIQTSFLYINCTVRHVTGTGTGLLGEIPRVVVQKSALYKGPL
jgi:hypothetical protein